MHCIVGQGSKPVILLNDGQLQKPVSYEAEYPQAEAGKKRLSATRLEQSLRLLSLGCHHQPCVSARGKPSGTESVFLRTFVTKSPRRARPEVERVLLPARCCQASASTATAPGPQAGRSLAREVSEPRTGTNKTHRPGSASTFRVSANSPSHAGIRWARGRSPDRLLRKPGRSAAPAGKGPRLKRPLTLPGMGRSGLRRRGLRAMGCAVRSQGPRPGPGGSQGDARGALGARSLGEGRGWGDSRGT